MFQMFSHLRFAGLVRTSIFDLSSSKVVMTMKILGIIFGKNPNQGAQTTVHLALSTSKMIEKCSTKMTDNQSMNLTDRNRLNGKYFSDCREETFIVSRQIGNRQIEEKLWQKTQALLKIKFEI